MFVRNARTLTRLAVAAILAAGCASGSPAAPRSGPDGSGRFGVTGDGTSIESVQAWIYPGPPACDARAEYVERSVDVLKPEYFTITPSGALQLRTEEELGCNGYTPSNAEDVRRHSERQYVTVSAHTEPMRRLFADAARRREAIDTLTRFVGDVGFTGVELDFEGFGGWTAADYDGYLRFVTDLGGRLQAAGHALMVDGPPIGSDREQGYYPWRYEDFEALPVDQIVVMAYDYQYDYGAGEPIAPTAWVRDIVGWVQARISDPDRIVIGLPSYGYHGPEGSWSITIDTNQQSRGYPGFETAVRDPGSFEMRWTHDGVAYVYVDAEALDRKRQVLADLGVRSISVWHLGGNEWFTAAASDGEDPAAGGDGGSGSADPSGDDTDSAEEPCGEDDSGSSDSGSSDSGSSDSGSSDSGSSDPSAGTEPACTYSSSLGVLEVTGLDPARVGCVHDLPGYSAAARVEPDGTARIEGVEPGPDGAVEADLYGVWLDASSCDPDSWLREALSCAIVE